MRVCRSKAVRSPLLRMGSRSRSASSRLLGLPHELLCLVYDNLEIESRACLNAELPKSARVVKTLKTDASRDAGLRVIAMYMKRMKRRGNKVGRFDDLIGRMRGFAAECAVTGDPTIARLFPDAPAPEPGASKSQTLQQTAQDRMVAAIREGKVGVVAELASAFTAKQVCTVGDLKEAVSKGSPATFDALNAANFFANIGIRVDGVAFSAVNYKNEALLAHLAGLAATDEVARSAMMYLARPAIAKIFAVPYYGSERVAMLQRVLGDRLSEATMDEILEEAMQTMNVRLAVMIMSL